MDRGALTADGCCVAETLHLLEEAARSGCEIPVAVVPQSARPEIARMARRVAVVPDRLFEKLGSTESSQGVIALVRPPVWSVEQLFGARSLVVVLDGVQDPGNAGSIVRAAEAFGATGVVFLKGSVSPFNPKTLRASAGSLFRVPFVPAGEIAPALRAHGLDIYAAVPGGSTLAQADLARPCALIVGSEARGVRAELRAAARTLSIPTVGVESLNAAVAAGILLYEAWRQRSRAS